MAEEWLDATNARRACHHVLQRRGPSLYLRHAGELCACDNNQSPGTSALKTVTSPEDKLALELRAEPSLPGGTFASSTSSLPAESRVEAIAAS